MKLSMGMLADRLSKYGPKVSINCGAPTISGFRLISGELAEFSPEHLYVGRASDAFSDEQYANTMILAHQYDLILLDDISLDDLLNEILLAFDFYNTWESSLIEASYAPEPMQQMVSLSEGIFQNPIAIMNREGTIIAYSQCYGRDDFNELWRDLVDTRVVPTSQFGIGIVTEDGKVLPEWPAKPQVYLGDKVHPDYIAANICVDSEFVGAFIIYGFKSRFLPHHCQLAERLCAAITGAAAGRGGGFQMQSNAAVLLELLDGKAPTLQHIGQLNGTRWSPPWLLIAIKSARAEISRLRKNSTLSKIRNIGIRTIPLIYGSEVLAVVGAGELAALLRGLEQIINPDSFAVGVSLPFSTWSYIPELRQQALFALDMNPGRPGVFFCRDYAFEHMIGAYRTRMQGLLMLHPAPETLREYDGKHQTEFYKTLFAYLSNDRNVVATSGELHIHRNTLLYRIKKIAELIDTALEDPDERVYVQMSYRIGDTALRP